MRVSLNWVKKYVDLPKEITNKQLSYDLTMRTVEVEDVIDTSLKFHDIIVGEILEVNKHPDADKLKVCMVNIGEESPVQIVCGGSNLYVGEKVVISKPGAEVYWHGEGDLLKIKETKMRGVSSYGMICGATEVYLEDYFPPKDESEIVDLSEVDCKPGDNIADIIGMNDTVLEIDNKSLTNRPDLWGHYGMAREFAALTNQHVKPLDVMENPYTGDATVAVEVANKDLVFRYTSMRIENVTKKVSSMEMQIRLFYCGTRAINLLADLTNYIMLELGQPMHAFDGNKIEKIVVDTPKESFQFKTLDDVEREITPDTLMIYDNETPVAVAGIMGGLNSEVRDTTTEVMFEAAKFARDNIRRSSRALGQGSDASQRYSKGVDEYTTEMAMKRALHLVEELGAGKISKTHKNVNTGNSLEPTTFKTSVKKVNAVLGITVPDEDILRILTGLNFQPEINGDELTMHFPAYREDMEDYPDVAEEVIRMYGYDHITSTFLPSAKVTIGGSNLRQRTILKVKRTLCSVGAFEGMHYSFFSPSDLDEMGFAEDAPERRAIRIMNPINEDLSLMRTTLAPQMIHAMGRNQKRGIFEGRIFEIGNAFIPKSLPLTEYPEERETLCIGAFGKEESFFTLKGMAEAVADVLNITFNYEKAEKPFLHPYQTAAIFCEGEEIGYLGKVKYEIMKEEAMREDAYVLEISMKALEKWYGKAKVFEPLPKFPEEKRDLALVMDKDITCGQVEGCIREACAYVKDVSLFDVYEGRQIAADKKSMAFTVLFTPKEEAFKADTVDGYVKKVLKQLNKTYGIELRS